MFFFGYKKVIISPIQTPLAEKIENNATSDTNTSDNNKNTAETVLYYRLLIVEKTTILNDLANKWDIICNEVISPPLSEDSLGDIRCGCGLARLLIDERFSQFSELIDKCEDTGNTNKELRKELDAKLVLVSDLQGFWDMIYHQVIDVEKRFLNSHQLRMNNWVEIIDQMPPVPRAKVDPAKFKAKINPLIKKKGVMLCADKETKEVTKQPKKARPNFAEFRVIIY